MPDGTSIGHLNNVVGDMGDDVPVGRKHFSGQTPDPVPRRCEATEIRTETPGAGEHEGTSTPTSNEGPTAVLLRVHAKRLDSGEQAARDRIEYAMTAETLPRMCRSHPWTTGSGRTQPDSKQTAH